MKNKILEMKVRRAKLLAELPFKDLKGVKFNQPKLSVEFGMMKAKSLALKGLRSAS